MLKAYAQVKGGRTRGTGGTGGVRNVGPANSFANANAAGARIRANLRAARGTGAGTGR